MCAMTVPPPDGPASQPPPPTRVVVIVPRREPGVHEYLQRALASIKDVEVVLEFPRGLATWAVAWGAAALLAWALVLPLRRR